jgi:hypothetical protein
MSTWKDKILELEKTIHHLEKKLHSVEKRLSALENDAPTTKKSPPPQQFANGYMTMSTPNLIPTASKAINVSEILSQNNSVFKN